LQKTAKHQHINILLLFTSLANQKAVAFSVLMLMLENQGTVSMLQHTRLLVLKVKGKAKASLHFGQYVGRRLVA